MEEAKQRREKGEPKIRRRIFRELEAIAFQDPKEYVKTCLLYTSNTDG